MSGGAFDYKQHFIEYMADEIEQRILNSGRKIPQEVLKGTPGLVIGTMILMFQDIIPNTTVRR